MDKELEQVKKSLAAIAAMNEASRKRNEEAEVRFTRDIAEISRLVKQNNKQLGELGNKLGSFTEGLAYPTIERILREQFGMTHISQNVEVSKGEDWLEIDAFGYTNGAVNRVVATEIKSHFRTEDIEQLEKTCGKIYEFMPEHRGKQVFGMVVFVKGDKAAIARAIKRGLYVVQANDENFKMLSAEGFVARDFGK